MSARAPEAIHALWLSTSKAVPHAVLSGIVGDTSHSFGYHLARRDLPASDYSVQLHSDRLGADDCASALDISLPPDLMRTVTRRLLTAAEAKDPRLKALREFCGTLDGAVTYPWDLSSNTSEGPGTWDDSHLWHVHLSFYRAFADDAATLAPIADVLAGVPLHVPATDPLEELMSFYKDRADFELAVRNLVRAELNRGVVVSGMQAWDDNDGKPGRDVHNPETLFMGVPGYRTVLARETPAPVKK